MNDARRRADLERAAGAIRQADALLITAGAGMGVDSGLPDFRGRDGFWKAYPPLARLGLDFPSLANPRWFRADPSLAWGFYGHRLHLYRAARPHAGYALLRSWATRMPLGHFVVTSNVDGQFEAAGFEPQRIVEVHGSIHHLQCLDGCGIGIVRADSTTIEIDLDTLRAREPLPRCPRCGSLQRPNILMFGDAGWDPARTAAQEAHLSRWLNEIRSARLVIIECGAGLAIPTIRLISERAVRQFQGTLIRINPREPEVPDPTHIALPIGARAALEAIEVLLSS
ncbi:MAG: NAD-dependent protein deacetylase [Isosphaeraceae bacterium]|jgi:NAD-dependent SIR2 family protein deacetylase|nr:MAG: NAD-dependent protein deacetylase [Isosphaeraceae bacterium]